MDIAGIQGAVKELEKNLPAETKMIFDRFDLSVSKAVAELDDVLTKHEKFITDVLSKLQLRMVL